MILFPLFPLLTLSSLLLTFPSLLTLSSLPSSYFLLTIYSFFSSFFFLFTHFLLFPLFPLLTFYSLFTLSSLRSSFFLLTSYSFLSSLFLLFPHFLLSPLFYLLSFYSLLTLSSPLSSLQTLVPSHFFLGITSVFAPSIHTPSSPLSPFNLFCLLFQIFLSSQCQTDFLNFISPPLSLSFSSSFSHLLCLFNTFPLLSYFHFLSFLYLFQPAFYADKEIISKLLGPEARAMEARWNGMF